MHAFCKWLVEHNTDRIRSANGSVEPPITDLLKPDVFEVFYFVPRSSDEDGERDSTVAFRLMPSWRRRGMVYDPMEYLMRRGELKSKQDVVLYKWNALQPKILDDEEDSHDDVDKDIPEAWKSMPEQEFLKEYPDAECWVKGQPPTLRELARYAKYVEAKRAHRKPLAALAAAQEAANATEVALKSA